MAWCTWDQRNGPEHLPLTPIALLRAPNESLSNEAGAPYMLRSEPGRTGIGKGPHRPHGKTVADGLLPLVMAASRRHHASVLTDNKLQRHTVTASARRSQVQSQRRLSAIRERRPPTNGPRGDGEPTRIIVPSPNAGRPVDTIRAK